MTHERATAEELGEWLAQLEGAELGPVDGTSCASPAATRTARAACPAISRPSWRAPPPRPAERGNAPARRTTSRRSSRARAQHRARARLRGPRRRGPGRDATTRCSATTTSASPRARLSQACSRALGDVAPAAVARRPRAARRAALAVRSRRSRPLRGDPAPTRSRAGELARRRLHASVLDGCGALDQRITTRYSDGGVESLLQPHPRVRPRAL